MSDRLSDGELAKLWESLRRDGTALGWRDVRWPRRELQYREDHVTPVIVDGQYAEDPNGCVSVTMRRRVEEFGEDISVCVFITPGLARDDEALRDFVFPNVTLEFLHVLEDRRKKGGAP